MFCNCFLTITTAVLLFVVPTINPLAAQSVEPQTVIENLNHPCGVAIHPESGVAYVSDSGNGRIVRIVDGVAEEVVAGHPVSDLGNEFGFAAGPLGMAFLGDENQLIVGSGGWASGEDRVHGFDLTESPVKLETAQTWTMTSKSGSGSAKAGDFYGIATFNGKIWVAPVADPQFGWLGQLTRQKADEVVFEPGIDTRKATGIGLPCAITISPDGFIVAGQHGENDNSSVLGFYDQATGALRAKFDLGQHGIVALAYGPNAGRLFALFNSRQHPAENGLYKLVARKRNTACEARLIHKLQDPRALAFATNGDLFVTAGRENGALLKFEGLDQVDTPDTSN